VTLIRSVLFMLIFYIWTILCCIVCSPSLILGRDSVNSFQVFWSHSVIFLLRVVAGVKLELRGQEYIPRDVGALIAMKHQSAFDTFALHAIVGNPAFIMKKELLKIPLYGTYCKRSGMIPIDRKGGASAFREMMKAVRDAVNLNRQVIIYPEGSRMPPGTKGEYKSGIYGMAKFLQMPVIPLAVNTGVYWPKSGIMKKPGTIVFEFCPPIQFSDDKKQFMSDLEQVMEQKSLALLPDGYLPKPE